MTYHWGMNEADYCFLDSTSQGGIDHQTLPQQG